MVPRSSVRKAAVTAIETRKERWCEAEVHRVAGEIALRSPEPDLDKAEAYFERALWVAFQQQAKSWELRASMSLARLWRSQGKVQQARELLAPVYGWFTEGFDTRDLKEAKALALARSALVEATEQLTRALAQIDALPATPELRREQIKLQVALITPLGWVKGPTAPETKAAAERARLLVEQAEALGEPPDDPLILFSALYATWNTVPFNGDVCRGLAAQFLALAAKQQTTAPRLIGHRIMGHTLFHIGEFVEAKAHFDKGLALYNAAEHRPLATRFWIDSRIMILCYRSLAAWVLGYPAAAISDSDQAVSDARDIGQAGSLMYALTLASLTHTCCSGHYATATARVNEVTAWADEKGSLIYKAIGTLIQAELFALNDNAAAALQSYIYGFNALRQTKQTLYLPWYSSGLARTYAKLGQFDDAWRCIGEAMTAAETTKEKWYEAEIHRSVGEIALLSPERHAAKAEAYFERALEVAQSQQAKSWELRAAISMARLWRNQGKPQQARELLGPIYSWFTEGLDTLDLTEAKVMLLELASPESAEGRSVK
jgi:predicted ATPase